MNLIDTGMMMCQVCGVAHKDDQFELTDGGSRPDFSSGEELVLNWIQMRCLVTGIEFQLSWFEGPDEEGDDEEE